MAVLYLLSPGSSVRKDAGRLIIEKEGTIISRMPIFMLTSIVVGMRANITTPALFACMEEHVPVFFIDHKGKTIGQIAGEAMTLRMLRHQLACLEDSRRSIVLAKHVVMAKLRGQYRLLKRYEKSVGDAGIANALRMIRAMRGKVSAATTADALRGMEGTGARAYFAAFSALIDAQLWSFRGRGKRPATDPVNALLNYGYAFLAREVHAAIVGYGLDARISFFHRTDGRRNSLVFDLMEPFRSGIIDRFVLQLLRRKCLTPEDFEITQAYGCRLLPAARSLWYERYETYMEKTYREYGGRTSREQIDAFVEAFSRKLRKGLREDA